MSGVLCIAALFVTFARAHRVQRHELGLDNVDGSGGAESAVSQGRIHVDQNLTAGVEKEAGVFSCCRATIGPITAVCTGADECCSSISACGPHVTTKFTTHYNPVGSCPDYFNDFGGRVHGHSGSYFWKYV